MERFSASTSAELARGLLAACLAGEAWDEAALETLAARAADPRPATAAEAASALAGILAEGLADRFEPQLADTYARLFARVFATVEPAYRAEKLLARYRRIRQPRRFEGDPDAVERVYVLSRVTLGADLAITSALLSAAKLRFPRARVLLAGPAKNRELFAADPRIGHFPVLYPRRQGGFRERLLALEPLRQAADVPGAVVLDPDSRLSQLGLIPIGAEENYYFFEGRAAGGDGAASLYRLVREWCARTLDTPGARQYLAAQPPPGAPRASVTVSLGVGENPAKRIPGRFEEELLRLLTRRGRLVIVDQGAGGEEQARVERLLDRLGRPVNLLAWQGSFAGFASLIAGSRLYLGYDSAGQHAAAVSGVPYVVPFTGHVCLRMLQRWTPDTGAPGRVIPLEQPDPQEALDRVATAIAELE